MTSVGVVVSSNGLSSLPESAGVVVVGGFRVGVGVLFPVKRTTTTIVAIIAAVVIPAMIIMMRFFIPPFYLFCLFCST